MSVNWPRALYCTAMDLLIWGGTGYVVFWRGESGWWFVAALFVSGAVGVPGKQPPPEGRGG